VDVLSPGENILAKIDALMERAVAVVVDATTSNGITELGLAFSKVGADRILVVVEGTADLPADARNLRHVVRPPAPFVELDEFLQSMENWLTSLANEIGPRLAEEPRRLLCFASAGSGRTPRSG